MQLQAISSSISGLVVEYIVAIDVTRVRFPADAPLASTLACQSLRRRTHRNIPDLQPVCSGALLLAATQTDEQWSSHFCPLLLLLLRARGPDGFTESVGAASPHISKSPEQTERKARPGGSSAA